MDQADTGRTSEARRRADSAPSLVVGPLLRYVGESEATVWVETDGACEVAVLGRRARSFQHDDWNTSEAWVKQMRARPWWEERIVGAFMSYWIYQHLGNLSPDELAADKLLGEVTAADDGTEALRAFALKASHETDGSQWSYCRRLGRSRLVVIDSRAGRVLKDGQRSMLDAAEWEWLERQLTGGFDHLLIATSLPLLLAPGLHYLEAWNEAVCSGAWGQRCASIGEHLRQRLDLEHWAAFEASFTRLVELIRAVGAGELGSPPASIGVLSGDVHHGYVAEAAFAKRAGVQSIVYQAVCSPFRHPLALHERTAVRAAMSRPATAITHALARGAGVNEPALSWRSDRPTFDNQVATLALTGRHARLTIERTHGNWHEPTLETVLEQTLT